jgi:hypothetical protein
MISARGRKFSVLDGVQTASHSQSATGVVDIGASFPDAKAPGTLSFAVPSLIAIVSKAWSYALTTPVVSWHGI